MANSKKPLEWSGMSRLVNIHDVNPVNRQINLALRDDEVAEIHKIEVLMELTLANATTGARIDYAMSMDPDIIREPTDDDVWEDLEVFHCGSYIKSPIIAIADVDEIDRDDKSEEISYSPPILVGTNIGISNQVQFITAAGVGSLKVKVFFTRRKANVQELNQILLKRR